MFIRSNLHTHSTFCDGKNTPEEIVLAAIDNGFVSIGFSGHGYTPYDLRYCMKDTDGYVAEIRRLKAKYGNRIKIFLGIEEDAYAPVDRSKFDYIIGSCHYMRKGDKYYPIDSSAEYTEAMRSAFSYDPIKISTEYFSYFCEYIKTRKPDIIGHFDLLTKFDEVTTPLFLQNKEYHKIAEKYLNYILPTDSIFEVNVGAILRGYRSTPYPYENLLHKIKKADGKLILALDAHSKDFLTYDFKDTINFIKSFGFSHVYTLFGGKFVKESI